MNELKVISLNECPYSMAAEDLINSIDNTEDLKININIIHVPREEKDKYTQGEMKTFPQIYFNEKLIGGYDDLNEIYLSTKGDKLDNIIELIQRKTKLTERRDMLRLIKFLNNSVEGKEKY
jgi:glutaredoxin